LQPIRTFEVVPFLPPELEHLRELAYNLRWTWDHQTINLFRRLDRDLWESSGHNPVLVLGTISQERLNEAAADEGFRNHLARIYENLREYMRGENTWFDRTYKNARKQIISYFSAEFGLTEALPIYSGGLGILAGDHVKAASELGLPFVGVGIVYQQGYFRQYLNPDGWQQQRYPMNDFYNLPITLKRTEDGAPLLLSVDFPGRKVFFQIWKAQVGRVPLYLLDTNIPQNSKKDEDITDALYHGDPETRIQQEIILGIGGFRALKALGIEPTVCHMNEGHSAFLALERIRMLMEELKLSFEQAKELAAAGNIFTTHTAVPAGFDKYSQELIEKYLGEYYRSLGLDVNSFMALGRANQYDPNEPFNMAHLAIELSSKTNAVSRLHGEVSRKLFGDVWKDLPEHEVPVTYITNGIHTRSWISEEMAELYDRYLGPTWSEESTDQNVWKRVEEIPDEELWRIHERRRERLVTFARRRVRTQMEARGAVPSELKEAAEVLNPEVLTIGFARRVATYKRAVLLLKDPDRLSAILNNKERPVQIIIAGKAHPEDTPAKELIRELIHFARRPDVRNKFVFIEDYDMNVARWMVQGADVWLNTPLRTLEACGTSGMKVAFNGGINVSILDGWWDEAYNAKTGWAIGHGEFYEDAAYQDTVESNALYDLLEKEIVPLFYDRDRYGRPSGWISRMKTSMLEICPVFNINRMVREYTTRAYLPAVQRYQQLLADDSAKAKDLAAWKHQLQDRWRGLQIESIDAIETPKIQVGDDMRVRAKVNLGKLNPDEVAVQIFHGPLDARGGITEGEIIPMTLSERSNNGSCLFSGAIRYFKSGRHGFTVRVLPHHDELASPFETGLITWAD
jgi:glycogen phosphorylase